MLDQRGQITRARAFANEVRMRLVGLAVVLAVSIMLVPIVAIGPER